MKDFFYKLSYGCSRSSLSNKELKTVTELEKLHLLSIHKDHIEINKDIIIGTVDFPSSSQHNKRNAIAYLVPMSKSADKDPIINGNDLKGATDGDVVLCKLAGFQRGRTKAQVLYVAKDSKPDIIGVALDDKGKILVKEFFTKNIIHTTSKQKSLRTLPKNAVLAIDFKTREIKEVLGILDDPHVDEKIVLKRYERKEEFKEETIFEADAFGDSVDKSMYPGRKDLTELPFITIDPTTAKDYDDAIYFDVGKNTLYVAIADVTEYVREFTSLDKEAKKRGFTIYFPHKSIPMLPRVLSENLCSLNEKVDRLVFTFKIHLTSEGKVDRFDLFEGVIRSQRRFTYDEIDVLLDKQETATKEEKDFLEFLIPLKNLTMDLRKKRLENGYTFRTPDLKIDLDENLKFRKATKEEETISHQLIEECMLLANISASTYFNYGIFRTHPAPDLTAINRLTEDLANVGIFPEKFSDIHRRILNIQEQADRLDIREIVDKMIIKSLKRAEYSYENVGHFGLGFDRYTHFTSPIRRYSDLILHRYLKAIISNNKKQENYINKILPFTTKIITSLEGETTKIAWDYEDLVFVRWAKENEKREFKGIVTDLGETGKDTIIKIEEHAFGARVFCKFEKSLRISNFDRVVVKIKKADLIGVRIFGEIVEIL